MTPGRGPERPAIRTPDQRLRVFVSSTLREVEPERRAARTAIEHLRLAPVMFELGARPHPPKELYRAYLEQSDVFVGIYWQSYGWVAPGEEISGLEDEYRLAPGAMPKLIYFKQPAQREERLAGLARRIQSDDTAAYKSFGTAEELAELLESDLATMLAERFDDSRSASGDGVPPPVDSSPWSRVPVPYSRLIGREQEVAEVVDLLASPENRVVTLVGAGGIGKSRLAIEVADVASAQFPDGSVFVALENVLEPNLLLPTIAYALGIRDTGEVPLEKRLEIAFEGRRSLVVLDNFEQLVQAAPVLVRLYEIAPDAAFLVTSRAVLRIRGERAYEVPPLATHDPASPTSVTRAMTAPAVELFVERARAVKPDFELTLANAPAVTGICDALQGLPLAIELAAARTRVLSPASILQRLDRQLPMLVDSSRDLPERQRTLRSTIEWSAALLLESQRALLADLGVFAQDFTLEAVEALGAGRLWDGEAIAGLAALVDSSLVSQRDVSGESVFTLLATVREYAIGRLQDTGDERRMRDAHAKFYSELARREARGLQGSGQKGAVARLSLERANLRAGVRHLVDIGDFATATDVAWRLYLYWWVGAYFGEVSVWMADVLARGGDQLTDHQRAVARFYVLWREMWDGPSPTIAQDLADLAEPFARTADDLGVAMATSAAGLAQVQSGDRNFDIPAERLRRGAERFRASGSFWGEVLSLVALGRIEHLRQHPDAALSLFRQANEAAVTGGDGFGSTIATHHLGRELLASGHVEEARRVFHSGLQVSIGLHHDEGIAYTLEGLCAIAALHGDVDRAGVLAGAAASIRHRVGMYDVPEFVFHEGYVERLRTPENASRLDEALARGREYGAIEAAEYALASEPGPDDVAAAVRQPALRAAASAGDQAREVAAL